MILSIQQSEAPQILGIHLAESIKDSKSLDNERKSSLTI